MASHYFPPAEDASRDGLVAIGGELTTDFLLDAYRHGIFPWPTDDDEPMLWWSPDPRAILPLDGMQVSQRLKRRLRSGKYRATADADFPAVMRACSIGPGRAGGTWITKSMIDAYCQLHEAGHTHSVEVWEADQLVGGVYGVSLGAMFCAESMFHRVTDGSKMALFHLVEHLKLRGYKLLDIQQWTPHTGRLGAIEIPRQDYLQQVRSALKLGVTFGNQLETSRI